MTLQDCEMCAYLDEVPYTYNYDPDYPDKIEWEMDAKCPCNDKSIFDIEKCPKRGGRRCQ